MLDKNLGPLILELNARPGLAIQIANGCGIYPRLQNIETLPDWNISIPERVAYSRQHFSIL